MGVAGKRDSQEICFVTQGHHSDFVKARRPEMVGATAGRNRHHRRDKSSASTMATKRFTVGQRKGLGVAMGTPHFVVRIEPDTRKRRDRTHKQHSPATGLIGRRRQLADRSGRSARPMCPSRFATTGRPNQPRSRSTRPIPSDSRSDLTNPNWRSPRARQRSSIDETQVFGGGWIC